MNNKNVKKRDKLSVLYLQIAIISLFTFFRLFTVNYNFSYDYDSYLTIIYKIGSMPFLDIIWRNLYFPYVSEVGIVDIEIGFALIVKALASLGLDERTVYATIAAASVGLRFYVMRAVGVPFTWAVALNIIAITLFEANALRLGVAVSILILGLRELSSSRRLLAAIYIALSILIHIQVLIFALPFFMYYITSTWISKSGIRLTVFILALCTISIFSTNFIYLLSNEKIHEYIARGDSQSAGISITSILGALLLISTALTVKRRGGATAGNTFFSGILTACIPSLTMLIFLTHIAVVGDRAWQVAFLVFSTFFFTAWVPATNKKIPHLILILLTAVVLTNLMLRFPLSNFFSPPFPTFQR